MWTWTEHELSRHPICVWVGCSTSRTVLFCSSSLAIHTYCDSTTAQGHTYMPYCESRTWNKSECLLSNYWQINYIKYNKRCCTSGIDTVKDWESSQSWNVNDFSINVWEDSFMALPMFYLPGLVVDTTFSAFQNNIKSISHIILARLVGLFLWWCSIGSLVCADSDSHTWQPIGVQIRKYNVNQPANQILRNVYGAGHKLQVRLRHTAWKKLAAARLSNFSFWANPSVYQPPVSLK